VALLTIRFRQSKRLAQELASTLLNVDVSLGAISKIEQQTSAALAPPVEEAREHVRHQAVANADETGWYEGKAEGKKEGVDDTGRGRHAPEKLDSAPSTSRCGRR
jgi:transposase